MTREEYNRLFHKEQLNLVAFKRLMDCDEEVLRLVNKAIEKERDACALMVMPLDESLADEIRARGKV